MALREIRYAERSDDDLQHALRGLKEALQARGISEADVISIESSTWDPDPGEKLVSTAGAFFYFTPRSN
jgi:FMN-dependent NADH-azoreductase